MKKLQLSSRTFVSPLTRQASLSRGYLVTAGQPQLLGADEAVKVIKSGDRVFVHSVAAAPQLLIDAMTKRAPELKDVEVCHMHIEGQATYGDKKYAGSFKNNNFFVGKNVRKGVQEGHLDYTPVFLSEIPLLFRRGILPLDVALLTVSPPDQHGYCSLGTSVDASLAALQCAKTVIAQVNPHMPRTHGDGFVHVSALTHMVDGPAPLIEHKRGKATEAVAKIGKNVAALVEDGATLQMGIGVIPDAVLAELTHHKRLGIHTEMFSDGVIDLFERGVITGEDKVIAPRTICVGFCLGTKRLYDFVHDNPAVQFRAIEWVNNPILIKENPKVTAINSALEVDLTGQICADSIGSKIYSGVGGQMDFMRGAALSHGGKPIIALPSTTARGQSKIVPRLKRGAGVVTTRAHVHWVVTEYGAVNLFGKPIKERMKALISIAHPLHRSWLEKEVDRGFWLDSDENSPTIPESASSAAE